MMILNCVLNALMPLRREGSKTKESVYVSLTGEYCIKILAALDGILVILIT